MEKNGTKKLSREELERKLAELENQREQKQKPKSSGLGWKIGLGVLVVGVLGAVIAVVIKFRKNKSK